MKSNNMNKAFYGMVFLLLTMGGVSCQYSIESKIKKTDSYYDLESLLDKQVYLLDSLNPVVEKYTSIGDSTGTQKVSLDSTGWKNELEIFYKMDINDPALKDAYEVVERQTDTLNILSYEIKEGKKADIQRLRVFFSKNDSVPVQIEGIFKEKNALYQSRRSLALFFQDEGHPPALSGYSIKGNQKMLMRDSVVYQIVVQNKF